MTEQLAALNARLSPADRGRLKRIWAPAIVNIPAEDARRNLCVMPDGEIRSYGMADRPDPFTRGRDVYLSSKNCGLDWEFHDAGNEGGMMLSAARSPWSGRYLTLLSGTEGTYVQLSEKGPGDPAPRLVKIADRRYQDLFQPVAMTSRKRWLCTGTEITGGVSRPGLLYSDDDGETWTAVEFAPTPEHIPVWPHLGVRWQNTGVEPNVAEMPDGKLMFVARTSLDYLYVYYSRDGGETWTDGKPSDFHLTLTTPFLLRLHDGRVVLFWNNTRPLAERRHEIEWPPVSSYCIQGRGEDVFTNRDANHAAVTDDGIHWTGCRELFLNQIRNAPDFRVKGGRLSSADKSVHQFQAIELPENKILCEFGQHEISRRAVIFDIGWLYETSRTEDFSEGLCAFSTQMYVKSISDCWLHEGKPGHCAWNRTDGALLVPDPDATHGEALQICRIRDERLVSELQGAVWNFPASGTGTLRMQIRCDGAGVRLRLCDHWINPSDPYAGLYALFDTELDSRLLGTGVWREAVLRFDTASGTASLSVDGECVTAVPMRGSAPLGVSYLHLQTMAEQADFRGTYIRRLDYTAG